MDTEVEPGSAGLNNLDLLQGCYPLERELDDSFVWTRARFRLHVPRRANFMTVKLAYLGRQGAIQVLQNGICVDRVSLRKGWQDCLLTLPPHAEWLSLEVSPVPKIEDEDRELGVMIRSILFFDDERRFKRSKKLSQNAILNDLEFRQGRSSLISYPPNLRITSEARCNIPETSQPCTYCAWDRAKELEKGSPAFTLDTLDELGDFYRDAQFVGDCSIGEPLMNKNLAKILARFDGDDKEFQFTTNGQLLVEHHRRQLLGKQIELYVSIDSATADGFKRYRNDQFDKIIGNLRALCVEKSSHRNLPKVTASFIAMRSNMVELEAFIRLMKDVGVDQVKLRTLYLDNNVTRVVINNGHRFDYFAEVLSKDELAVFGTRARQIAAENELPLYVEWDQFESERTDDRTGPLCAEPWKTLYVLARGIMPCCYATEPLARWEDQGERSLDDFLRDTFNSAEYQTLRRELAAGRLAPYCRNTPSCPVLKRMTDESGTVSNGPRPPFEYFE
jgi:MoaA/NifB/PqqE/SkfB family radical SAM enzyme